MGEIKSWFYQLTEPQNLVQMPLLINTRELQDDEIVAETKFTVVSPGTETAAFMGSAPLRPGVFYPRLVGYCNIAQVIDVGELIDKVAVNDYILTFQSHRTHFVIKKSDFFLKLPNLVNIHKFTPLYLFHLGYNALLTSPVEFGHNVGIIGGGVLGVTSSIMARLAGAKTFLFTNQRDSIQKLEPYNVEIMQKTEKSIELMKKQTHFIGLDKVINTSNSWEDWFFALNAVNKGGTIVNIGFPGRDQALHSQNSLDPQFVYDKNINIKSLCYVSERDVPYFELRFNMQRNLMFLMDLVMDNSLDPMGIITNEIHYSELEAQYKSYCKRESYMLSTLVKWND